MNHVIFPYILVFSRLKEERIVLRNPLINVVAMIVAVYTPARPAFGLLFRGYSFGMRPLLGQDFLFCGGCSVGMNSIQTLFLFLRSVLGIKDKTHKESN